MKPRIAIVCDWLTSLGGAERVIWELHELFPDAPIFTSVYDEKKLPHFSRANIIPSFLQKFPFAKKKYQYYLPLLPFAFEECDLSAYDIVISSSHSAAKGIITKPSTLHISYCHSPMRYVWGNYHEYIKEYGIPQLLHPFMERFLHRIRMWDRLAADRVDFFIANSRHVQKRIKKYYRRDSTVIYPPVDTERFSVSRAEGEYFVAVGRLIPYKKFDLLVETWNERADQLLIVGEGRSLHSLKRKAKPNITFLGALADKEVTDIYKGAKALLYPQLEDFGITPLEAMAAGKPVIAYGGGGALETVIPGKTGLFFFEQTKESLGRALAEFEAIRFSPQAIRAHAEKFDRKIFAEKILQFVEEKWGEWKKQMK